MEHTLEFILNYCAGCSLAKRPARRSDNERPSPGLRICEMWVCVLGGIGTLPGDIGTVLKSPAGWAPSYTRDVPATIYLPIAITPAESTLGPRAMEVGPQRLEHALQSAQAVNV